MKLVELSTRQPISVVVGILFTLMAGIIAFQMVPVEMAPEVENTIISISTRWENASPQEIESEIIEPQEDKLQGLTNLRNITSTSSLSEGKVRLEFNQGVDKDKVLREVSDKLREVPSYPFGVDEPVVEATDPDSIDYIAWYILSTTDESYDVRTFLDFAEDNIKPGLESIEGMSEVNILGGTEKEVQIIIDPQRVADHGITMGHLVNVLRNSNTNASGGAMPIGKLDIRIRAVGRFSSPESVKKIVIGQGEKGTVKLGDVATVAESYKEPFSFVRTKGKRALAFNFQREPGSNVLDIMELLKEKVAQYNQPGGILDRQTKSMGLKEPLVMEMAFDASRYVRQAINNVNNNIYIGGALAIAVLLLFLRSLRSLGIIALSIPVSMVGAIVLMVALGRTVNVISLAGIAFAVGMVVDNSIVVLENIYRHLEMGKKRFQAAYDGTVEVAGAVLASSLTTLIVFVPILLISDQAGQLFRDIALSIMTAVAFSYVVAVTVIPSVAARILNEKRYQKDEASGLPSDTPRESFYQSLLLGLFKSTPLRIVLVVLLAMLSIFGSWYLMPDMDYLPKGNRNVTFGFILVPPGLNLEEMETMGLRVENVVRPYWEGKGELPPVPDVEPSGMGGSIVPTHLENYFLVGVGGTMFHGSISTDDRKAIDNKSLLTHASRPEILPGSLGFAFQFPLFRVGGASGSAVSINLTGDDLDEIAPATFALFMHLMQNYPGSRTQPSPTNFNLKVQELQVRMKDESLAEAGLTRQDVIAAIQVAGDGVFLGQYQMKGDLVDLKVWSKERDSGAITQLGQFPMVTAEGKPFPLSEVAEVLWTEAPEEIKRVDGKRAVTLEFTAPAGMPLESVVGELEDTIMTMREAGIIPPTVDTQLDGAAGKLTGIRKALLGDDLPSFISSSLFLSFTAVYLLMCILFQSWSKPLVIMFTVPLATFGGFIGLALVHFWSTKERYMPEQNLDVLTLLGFVILSGVVVNNAILIVAQTKQLLDSDPDMDYYKAIASASESRIRPIFMSLLTSVGGMLPLILNPGAGSELYRGLGAVVVGGMLLSTLFTLILIPILMSLLEDLISVFRSGPKVLAVGLLVLPLIGCQNIMSKTEPDLREEVSSELPESFSKQLEVKEDAIPLLPWWAGFQDPLLNELVGSFLQDHPGKVLFEARLEEAETRLGRENLELLPSATLSSSLVKENNVVFGFKNDRLWTVRGDLSWELDWTGRVRHAIRAQLSHLRAIEHEYTDWKVSAHIALIQNHLMARSLRQALLLHEDKMTFALKSLKLNESLVKTGRVDRRILINSKTFLEAVQQERLDLTLAMDLARMEVESWAGLKLGSLISAYEEPFRVASPSQQGLGLPLHLLERRPDLRIAEEQVLMEAAQLDIAKVEILPYLQFTGSVSWTAPKVSDVFNSSSRGFQFGPGLSWRILELPRVMKEKDAQKARLQQSLASYRQMVRDALLEVEMSLSDYHSQNKVLVSQQSIVELNREQVDRSKHLNEVGRISKDVLFRDEINHLDSRIRLNQIEMDRWIKELKVYRSLGG